MKRVLTASQKGCRKKCAYRTEARARIIGAYKATKAEMLWVYKCPECESWHLTKREGTGVVGAPITPGNSGILGAV